LKGDRGVNNGEGRRRGKRGGKIFGTKEGGLSKISHTIVFKHEKGQQKLPFH